MVYKKCDVLTKIYGHKYICLYKLYTYIYIKSTGETFM